MKKSDFKKGQTVYLFVIEGSNEYRRIRHDSLDHQIKEAVVVSVGSKYITVTFGGWPIRFDANNFEEVTECSRDYELYLSKKEIYDVQMPEMLYKEIRTNFQKYRNDGRFSIEQLEAIRNIIKEGTNRDERRNSESC